MTEKFARGTIVEHERTGHLGEVVFGGVRWLEGPEKFRVYDAGAHSGDYWKKPTRPFSVEPRKVGPPFRPGDIVRHSATKRLYRVNATGDAFLLTPNSKAAYSTRITPEYFGFLDRVASEGVE